MSRGNRGTLWGVKVVSKFKDYDDSVRAQDLDKEPFYLRETQVFPP